MGSGSVYRSMKFLSIVFILFVSLGCKKITEAINEKETTDDTIVANEDSDAKSDDQGQIIEDLGDGRYLVYENPDALEEWIDQSADCELLGSPDFGVGVRLYINPANISVPMNHDWDELAGLILWGFAAVKEPGDKIPCCGGEVRFVRRIGSQLVHENGQYLGGEEDWLVNEFSFSNAFAAIDGVIALAYEGGDFYFNDIASDLSDEQVLLRLARMSLDDFEEFYLYEDVEISERTKSDLENQ